MSPRARWRRAAGRGERVYHEVVSPRALAPAQDDIRPSVGFGRLPRVLTPAIGYTGPPDDDRGHRGGGQADPRGDGERRRGRGGLRVGVKAGGCSGFSYVFRWETEPRPDDEVFDAGGGMKIFVDSKSCKYLRGTVLDCDASMLGQSLIFRNPNAKSECGCGLSFDV